MRLAVQGFDHGNDRIFVPHRVAFSGQFGEIAQVVTKYEGFIEKSIVEEKVRRAVEKSVKMHAITEVSIRIKKQRTSGERTMYKITARALGPKDSFNAEKEDWGLMETMDGVIVQLAKTMRRAKKPNQKGTRRGRKRPNPHLKP